MEKERKIEAPEGCEIEKVELVDGVAVVTFREKERKLPKTWEEFCDMFPNFAGEYFIVPDDDEKIDGVFGMLQGEKRTYRNAELLPDRATAEAVLALCQLIQLRNAYNGDWVLEKGDKYYCIVLTLKDIDTYETKEMPEILYFKSGELRDEFLRNFRDLIEKLKPLYGIKEGGEE